MNAHLSINHVLGCLTSVILVNSMMGDHLGSLHLIFLLLAEIYII